MKAFLATVLILLAVVGFPTKAFAHMVETNYILDDQLEFQSTFSTGEPFAGATVQIFAPNNLEKPWLELTTDEQGRFAFMPDESIQGDWEISIKEAGHSDYWTVPVGENGIEYDNITLDTHTDIHYAAGNAKSLLVFAVSAGLWGLWMGLRQQQRRTRVRHF